MYSLKYLGMGKRMMVFTSLGNTMGGERVKIWVKMVWYESI